MFIRGVDSNLGPEFGIFNDVPESKFIEKLGRVLIPGFVNPGSKNKTWQKLLDNDQAH